MLDYLAIMDQIISNQTTHGRTRMQCKYSKLAWSLRGRRYININSHSNMRHSYIAYMHTNASQRPLPAALVLLSNYICTVAMLCWPELKCIGK